MEFAAKYEPSSLLEYLRALGTIRVIDSEVDLVADSVLACNSDAGKTVAPKTVVSHLKGFLGSVEFNLLQVGERKHGRFERAAYASISPELTPVFQRFVETRAQNFVDAVDEWLTRHKAVDCQDIPLRVAGAGAYVFIHNSNIFK